MSVKPDWAIHIAPDKDHSVGLDLDLENTRELVVQKENITDIRHGSDSYQPLEILEFVYINQLRGCANDLDRIYALMGLVREDDVIVDIKYSCSVEELYTSFTSNLLKRNSLKVLHWMGKRTEHSNPRVRWGEKGFLPSWVPDCKILSFLFL